MKAYWVFMTLEIEAKTERSAEWMARNIMLNHNKVSRQQVVWAVDSICEVEEIEEVGEN